LIKTQFTLYLKNEPGALARAIRKFAAGGINIEGISVAKTTDLSLVQLVVSNAGKARQLLKRSNAAMTEQKVAVLPLADEPGALAKAADRLARKKVNINYLYATSTASGSSGTGRVVVSSDDLKAVESNWQR
jgi:hypothetical protein